MHLLLLILAIVSYGTATQLISNERQLQRAQPSSGPLTKATPSLEDGDDPSATHVFMQNLSPKDFLLAVRLCSSGVFDIWPQLSIPSGTGAHFSMKGPSFNSTSPPALCLLQYATADRRTWFYLEKMEGANQVEASSSPDISFNVEPLNFPPLPNAVSVEIYSKDPDSSLQSGSQQGATPTHLISNGEQLQIPQPSEALLTTAKEMLRHDPSAPYVLITNPTPRDFNLTLKVCSVGGFDIQPPSFIHNYGYYGYSMTGQVFNSTVHLVLCTLRYEADDGKTWFYVKKHDGDSNVKTTSSDDLRLVVMPIDKRALPNAVSVNINLDGSSSSPQKRPLKRARSNNVFVKASKSGSGVRTI